MKRKEKVKSLIENLCAGLYEREEVMKLALLSAVAGESIFLLGPPGVGKSLVARRLKFAFADAQSFEYLMTRFSTPEEVFGPVSIKKLKEEDKYERQTDKYMPGANLVFLDEIWKASSSIQNALLTIINEKVYRNGEQEIKVDLKSLITASNELPPEGENFGPLYDRLLVRYHLDGIKNQRNFLKMITGSDPVYKDQVTTKYKISNAELEVWHTEIDAIAISDEVLSVIQITREKIEQYNQKQETPRLQIKVYDRRWKKLIRLLRTSAFLNERQQVDLMDCFLMTHALWNQPEQIEPIQEMVSETIRKHGYSVSLGLSMLRKEIDGFEEEVEQEVKIKNTKSEEVLRPIEDEYYGLRKNGEQFSGKYIMVKDYNKLKLSDLEVINVYDDEFKLVNRLGAEKTQEQFGVRLRHNSVMHPMKLETYQREKIEYLFKKPHALVKQFWDERYEKIETYLNTQKEKLKAESPQELQHINANLFVDQRLAEVVKTNHQEVSKALDDLTLKLEKARHMYESLD